MANLSLPLSFRWKVAHAGYQWFDTKDGRRLCAIDALQPDWHNLFDRYERTYRPLQERTGLFREFAALEPTEAQVLDFANRFGMLAAGDNLQLDSEFGCASVHGESLLSWKDEIDSLKLANRLWEIVISGNTKALAQLKAELATPDMPLAVQRTLHLDDPDPALFTLGAIQRITDSRLRQRVEVRLLFHGDQARLAGSIMPRDLLGVLWLQFAAAVDAGKSFARCGQCGVPFELSRATPTGKRRDAQFCSARCRVAHYRDRIERARQLAAKGLSSRQIAHELGTQPKTVNRWLKDAGGARARP